jgi:molybdopterin molybdotransferase
MVEECEDSGTTVRFNGKSLKSNICYKGEDIREGDKVLETGTFIKPEQIAILASFGVTNAFVAKHKKIGILSTGDEIIEPDAIPTLVQIRNSNGWQLRAQALRAGAIVNYYGIASDSESSLREKLEKALNENDIVILSGGVSMGDFDFVPAVLDEFGLKTLFNKVAVQPGKPSTFAVKYSQDGSAKKVVFALPGNPVSCFVQFELLIKPFLFKSMGGVAPGLKADLPFKSDYSRKHTERLALIPVRIDSDGSFSPVKYNGSAHITALNGANGIAEIPLGAGSFAAGEKVKVYILP